ncbi:glutamine-hydrolyzing carbamoyl-phosphate synthase small subunit [Desulfosporosinus sp. BICA1-9]|uniref:glutamine-hydrolyzing carbamoyl-phosphate synthase small subunit n=1 Tax=Desulfosporosinus sp. BICA1-9 TaxID=1531958 RepID=UPI00054B2210|nr:glutamine-hydrolyzing carbamoyl-phosphate synthase small subunit [Desulfosporosinus sp. BICA1-9]KJS48904.1 MAG: carbamoyl-phosphate synthase [Peptococcaceae bacterium BRH_c23]KJS79430.1 MAG: carbamoyl-phosphate synthase [Desulfosporosinus sp. BICA1-9]KJS89455.1 MAG: carbamoyl-phosphate synthase [Desulfosporosinus sp. BICA1-9]HBW37440.1 carbamoyl-phosphate synthase (glutamine-hydrolyzing) small subunit [Desulfosporosinus sp.]
MAYLVFQDGTTFEGEAFGAWLKRSNSVTEQEVVFNTSMSGYQEMVTDLSYAGQILVLTQPQIGNYGWHHEENEADKTRLQGLILRELSQGEGSLHGEGSLEDYCLQQGVQGLKGVDTRALTRYLRQFGTLPGVLVETREAGLEFWTNYQGQNEAAGKREHWVYRSTVKEAYEIPGSGPLLAVLDFGVKRNIIRHLQKRGFRIMVFPARSTAEEILSHHPRGLVLSNGPGDPEELPEEVATVRRLYDKLPVLGICLGHQLLALAAGGETYKLPYGHRGGNHPVIDTRSGKATMTSQNHGYAVQEASLAGSGFEVTLLNLNDGTVEGMEHQSYPVLSVQFHPEGAPGPEENAVIFDRFKEIVEKSSIRKGRK